MTTVEKGQFDFNGPRWHCKCGKTDFLVEWANTQIPANTIGKCSACGTEFTIPICGSNEGKLNVS